MGILLFGLTSRQFLVLWPVRNGLFLFKMLLTTWYGNTIGRLLGLLRCIAAIDRTAARGGAAEVITDALEVVLA